MIETRRIHQALALARHRNFARAAVAVGVTQPALTRSIRLLEEELGVRLFDRLPRDVVPTEFGRLLVERGERLLGALAEMRGEIDRLRGLESGQLAVGGGVALETTLVGPAVGRLVTRHPALRVRLRIDPVGALTRLLRAGEIELFVAYAEEAADEPDLEVANLGEHRGIFYCRPDHPLSGRADVGLREMLEYPVAGPDLPGKLMRRLLRGSRVRRSGEPPIPTIVCRSLFAAKAIVLAGDVIGYAPIPVVAAELRDGSLTELPFPLGRLQGMAGIVKLRGRTLSSAAEKFVIEIRQVDQELAD